MRLTGSVVAVARFFIARDLPSSARAVTSSAGSIVSWCLTVLLTTSCFCRAEGATAGLHGAVEANRSLVLQRPPLIAV